VNQETAPFDQARLTLGFGGLLVERLISETPFGGLALGVLAGGGSWTLHLIETAQGDFRKLVENPPRYAELERGFWFALPYLAFEAKLIDFLGLRISGGYGITIGLGDWKLPDGQPVPGGPLGSAAFPSFQLMLVFGG
jgi:hypothetical protein